MKRSAWLWPLVILVSVVSLALVAFAGIATILRPALTLWFMLICPGMALVQLLAIRDRVAEFVLAVTLSLALEVMISLGMVLTGHWSVQWGLIILMGISVIGAALQIAKSYRVTNASSRLLS